MSKDISGPPGKLGSSRELGPPREECESLDDPMVKELRDSLRVAVPVESSDVVQQRRARLLGTIEAEIKLVPARRKREERKQSLALVFRYVAAAAVLAATLGLGMLLTRSTGGEQSQKLAAANTLVEASPGAGSLLAAAHQAERLFELPGQTRLLLNSDSRVALIDDSVLSQVMHLQHGSLRVDVPPLSEGSLRSVSVLTPHAQVKVKGTIFTVDLLEEQAGATTPGRSTRVSVERGVVEVAHAGGVETLRAGETWQSEPGALLVKKEFSATESSSAETTATSPSASTAAPTAAAVAVAAPSTNRAISEARSTAPRRTEKRQSTLAAQNTLLESALNAADRGDRGLALKLTSQLLTKYPNSPLRASAQAVRRRVQSKN